MKRKKRDLKPRLITLILSAAIMVADQATKALVLRLAPREHAVSVIGDFFRIINVQNPAFVFSIGRHIARGTQRSLGLVRLLVICLFFLYYMFTRERMTGFQRWCFGAVIGAGLGNFVDWIIRPAGVVDFLDFKFYGIFGLERWPAFNLADMSLVISVALLFISFLIPAREPPVES